jgi:hypothetical protein
MLRFPRLGYRNPEGCVIRYLCGARPATVRRWPTRWISAPSDVWIPCNSTLLPTTTTRSTSPLLIPVWTSYSPGSEPL